MCIRDMLHGRCVRVCMCACVCVYLLFLYKVFQRSCSCFAVLVIWYLATIALQHFSDGVVSFLLAIPLKLFYPHLSEKYFLTVVL